MRLILFYNDVNCEDIFHLLGYVSTMDLKLRKKLVKCYIWSITLYGAETWTLRAADQKPTGKFLNVVVEKDGEDQLDRSSEK